MQKCCKLGELNNSLEEAQRPVQYMCFLTLSPYSSHCIHSIVPVSTRSPQSVGKVGCICVFSIVKQTVEAKFSYFENVRYVK